jgi:hypothetical protein
LQLQADLSLLTLIERPALCASLAKSLIILCSAAGEIARSRRSSA